MRLASFLIYILLLCSFQMKDELKPSFIIKGNFDFFTTDNLENVYLINNDELIKYQADNLEQYTFSSKLYGSIGSVDFNFPLKPILFYQDIRQLVFLDNTLSIQGSAIDLGNLDLLQSTLSCTSIGNNYWLFDQMESSLNRLNSKFEVKQQTENLNQQLRLNLEPNFMVEHDDWLYVNNPETGILVFDLFGAYLKTIPITGLTSFQCIENSIVFAEGNSVFKFDKLALEKVLIHKSNRVIKQARVEKQKLYLLLEDELEIYKLKNRP